MISILEETPVENVVAMFDTIRSCLFRTAIKNKNVSAAKADPPMAEKKDGIHHREHRGTEHDPSP